MSYIVWENDGRRDLGNYNFIRDFFSDLHALRGYFRFNRVEREESDGEGRDN